MKVSHAPISLRVPLVLNNPPAGFRKVALDSVGHGGAVQVETRVKSACLVPTQHLRLVYATAALMICLHFQLAPL